MLEDEDNNQTAERPIDNLEAVENVDKNVKGSSVIDLKAESSDGTREVPENAEEIDRVTKINDDQVNDAVSSEVAGKATTTEKDTDQEIKIEDHTVALDNADKEEHITKFEDQPSVLTEKDIEIEQVSKIEHQLSDLDDDLIKSISSSSSDIEDENQPLDQVKDETPQLKQTEQVSDLVNANEKEQAEVEEN